MQKGKLPVCAPDASFRDVVNAITYGRMGLTLVMENAVLRGIITDGDLRRAFESYSDVNALKAEQMMSVNPLTIAAQTRVAEAEAFMLEKEVGALVVQDAEGKTVGVLQIYGLKDAGQEVLGEKNGNGHTKKTAQQQG